MAALESAEEFIALRPSDEVGCLYFQPDSGRFVNPEKAGKFRIELHFGRPGGVLPGITE